jgi:hypothetical protein
VARDSQGDYLHRARAKVAVETLRALHASDGEDPFSVLRVDLQRRLGRPKPGRRVARDLLHLAEALTALAAEAEATRFLHD